MANFDTTREALRQGQVHPGDNANATAGGVAALSESEELELLRGENAGLQARVEELEQFLTATAAETEERWNDRQREYESLLEEKSEVIRALHVKLAETRELAAASSRPAARSSNASDTAELETLKKALDEQRRQMAEDEESMMAQMRQMEMALARDRAELARQRAELQRLHNELKHELELAARDCGLRERLGSLQRRSGAVGGGGSRPGPSQETPPPQQLPPRATPPPQAPPAAGGGQSKGGGGSGVFRRLFGNGQ